VTKPANDYVGEFTKNVSRSKLLSVGSIMDAPSEQTHPDASVNQHDKVATIAAKVLETGQDVRVVDPENKVVGLLKRQKLIDALFQDGFVPK